MSDAGNAELPRMFRIEPTYLVVFILLFVIFFTLVNVATVALTFQESLLQRLLTILNVTSFVTLIATLILHTIHQNKDTTRLLLISCGVFIIFYYGYVVSKALSRGLAITPYPLLLELRGSSNSAYVIDLPQIIIISLLIYYVYKKRRKHVPKDLRDKVSTELPASLN